MLFRSPYRYRWPDAVRDEVLARLLDLNQQRHQQEVAAGLHGEPDEAPPPTAAAKAPRSAKAAPRSSAAALAARTLSLFPPDEGDAS